MLASQQAWGSKFGGGGEGGMLTLMVLANVNEPGMIIDRITVVIGTDWRFKWFYRNQVSLTEVLKYIFQKLLFNSLTIFSKNLGKLHKKKLVKLAQAFPGRDIQSLNSPFSFTKDGSIRNLPNWPKPNPTMKLPISKKMAYLNDRKGRTQNGQLVFGEPPPKIPPP